MNVFALSKFCFEKFHEVYIRTISTRLPGKEKSNLWLGCSNPASYRTLSEFEHQVSSSYLLFFTYRKNQFTSYHIHL